MALRTDDVDRSGATANRSVCYLAQSGFDLPAGDWTLQYWVKMTDNVNSFPYHVSMNTYSATSSFTIYVSSGRPRLLVEDDAAVASADLPFTDVFAGNWYLMSAVKRSGTVYTYQNAIQRGSSSVPTMGKISCVTNGSLGGYFIGTRSDEAADRFMNADFADFAIWHRALTVEEMERFYAGGYRPIESPDQLKIYDPLDDPIADPLVGYAPKLRRGALRSPGPGHLKPLPHRLKVGLVPVVVGGAAPRLALMGVGI